MPPSNVLYTGPVVPTVWDPGWRRFTNLTAAQILVFQGFQQDLLLYAAQRRWLAEISGVNVAGIPLNTQDRDQSKIGQLKQAFDNGTLPNATPVNFFDATGAVHAVDAVAATAIYQGIVDFVQNTYAVAANMVAGINIGSITTRKEIDAAYAAIAPNSPSALNPSET